jgi:hypothetical protein
MSLRRRASLFSVAVVSAIGLCWTAQVAWNRSASFLATTWLQELDKAPEREVDGLVARICNLGDHAIPTLVAALASHRECVSHAAAKAMRREMDGWRLLSPEVRSPRWRRLVGALVEAWPRLEGPSRRLAAELLGDLVSPGLSGNSRQDAQLLAACADVLRSAPPCESSPSQFRESAPASPPAPVQAAPVPAAPVATLNEALKRPPSVHAVDPPRGFEQANAAGSAGPAPLPPGASEPKPLSAAGSETGTVGKASETAPSARNDAPLAAANEPRRLPEIQHASLIEPGGPRTSAGKTVEPAEVSRLVDQLNDDDPQRETAARRRLEALGWSAREIEVAKRLRHPDAAVRRALARSLPDMVGVDAAPWLLELSRDADPDIRLEAMTLLATTGDPALVDTVRTLAASDPDERIQKLAARLAQASSAPATERSR